MDCNDVGKLIQRYLDGELDGSRGTRLAEHLEMCAYCEADAETFRELKAALARSGEMPPATVERLREFGQSLVDGDGPRR